MVTPIEVCNGVEGSQPSFSSHSLFLLRAQLPLISHSRSRVCTGRRRNEISIPLFSTRPAFIMTFVAPVSELCDTPRIWSVVVFL